MLLFGSDLRERKEGGQEQEGESRRRRSAAGISRATPQLRRYRGFAAPLPYSGAVSGVRYAAAISGSHDK
jgi:hypothetical protein